MHPIERLRYVARAGHVPGDVLARETAMALADFVGDDAAMLIACRRILDRQPTSAPLVWLAAHALGAPNQRQALWDAVETLEGDSTRAALAYSLPDDAVVGALGWSDAVANVARKRGDVSFVIVDTDGSADYRIDRDVEEPDRVTTVDAEAMGAALLDVTHLLIEFDALGADNGLAAIGSFPAAAAARHLEVEVWGVVGIGVALGDRMYAGLIRRWHEGSPEAPHLRPIEEVPSALVDRLVTTAGLVDLERALAAGGCPIVPELF